MRRLAVLLVAVIVAALAIGVPAHPVEATGHDSLRVVARKLANGKVEVGVRVAGETTLPRVRMFPYATVAVGKWLDTSYVTLHYPSEGAIDVMVSVRRLADGGVEVWPFTPDVDIALFSPESSVFPYGAAAVGEWWQSSPAPMLSQRSEELEGLASWFWPPGTCAFGTPDDPGGALLFCTPPEGASTYREHLDAFLAMLAPFWPWIGATLDWAGGYRFGTAEECDATPGTTAGCYRRSDRQIVLVSDALPRRPLWSTEETLLHEIAHAFDHMSTVNTGTRPSFKYMVRYPDVLRPELFAEALVALVLDDRSDPVYYRNPDHAFARFWDRADYDSRADFETMLDRVPNRVAMWDRVAAIWAVYDWCDRVGRHGFMALGGDCMATTEIVWPSGPSRRIAASAGSDPIVDAIRAIAETPIEINVTFCGLTPPELSDPMNAAWRAADDARSAARWIASPVAGNNPTLADGLRASADHLMTAREALDRFGDNYCTGDPIPSDILTAANRLTAAANQLCAEIDDASRRVGLDTELWRPLIGC